MSEDPQQNRHYEKAKWHPKDAEHPSPKVSGGVEKDSKGRDIPARGYNRPDQRYSKPLADILSGRRSKAEAEFAASLVLQHTNGGYLVVSAADNKYTVNATLHACDCGDDMRLAESEEPLPGGNGQTYKERGADCKHILIVNRALASPPAGGLPWTTAKLAEAITAGAEERGMQESLSERTVALHCANGGDRRHQEARRLAHRGGACLRLRDARSGAPVGRCALTYHLTINGVYEGSFTTLEAALEHLFYYFDVNRVCYVKIRQRKERKAK